MTFFRRPSTKLTMAVAPVAVVIGAVVISAVVISANVPAARAAEADAGQAGGAIDSVVVFVDRARVSRVASAACEGGKAKVTFVRLPDALDPRTLRGEVAGAAEVIGLLTDRVTEQKAADPRARELEEQQERLLVTIRGLDARRSAIASELEGVDAYRGVFESTVTEEMRNPHPSTAAWSAALESFRARRAAREEERRKNEIAMRALRRQLERVDRELAGVGLGVGSVGTRAHRTAAVVVACRDLKRVSATLSYVVPGATWRPEYDLDFTPRGRGKGGPGLARLTVGALIRQTTGEDWPAARVSLSTARPKLGSEAPQPAPLLVEGAAERRDNVLVQAQERRDELKSAGGAGRTGPTAADLDDKGNAFVLTLPHRVTVVADGRPLWSPVDVREAAAAVKLVATPKLDEHVYQVVALPNPCAYPLLEGRVRAYRAGSFVGDAAFPYRGVGEPMEVSLGIDEEMKVERKTVDDRDQKAGLLASTKHLVRSYRVKVANGGNSAETVEVRENIPVSQVDEVKIEVVAQRTTPGYVLDARRGFMTWSVPLKSGEWRTTDLGYAIHLPDSWQVNGVQ